MPTDADASCQIAIYNCEDYLCLQQTHPVSEGTAVCAERLNTSTVHASNSATKLNGLSI